MSPMLTSLICKVARIGVRLTRKTEDNHGKVTTVACEVVGLRKKKRPRTYSLGSTELEENYDEGKPWK